ncbi:hypothetical protein V1L54_09500 [Streptomyces sp. TRM 70361]|uniref:DUF6892 domain-containing protein n=1 Tax=Streptomyces sp. TRM 70361 TaxID=3116553 RepID=UPI002E7C55E1|nr:hypothetical protein [Streptomyces sp. TRM 70361]MEE1939648.1 hypothetical protein [Streptomyces sp. TRM 70361]
MTAFRDFDFKLLVVEKLMYWDRTLTPPFSMSAYMRKKKGVTSLYDYVEDNGLAYTVLDEARDFFERLHIGDELLATVDTLVLDGGHQVYMECAPVWDGEDDLSDVRSLDDLPLLPNLGRIIGADSCGIDVPGKHETLAARDIAVD